MSLRRDDTESQLPCSALTSASRRPIRRPRKYVAPYRSAQLIAQVLCTPAPLLTTDARGSILRIAAQRFAGTSNVTSLA